jgi:glycine betaine/proline transport system ATP-binding protein
MVRVSGLYKIYGATPTEAKTLIAQGRSAAELRQSGKVLGLSNVSFNVSKGQTYIIMGLSGSGKSTLVRCLNRLVEPTAGTIEIAGQDVSKLSSAGLRQLRAKAVSMVFQQFGLLPHRRVLANVTLGLEAQGLSKPERERRAHQALELVGLESWADFYPDELSGGMQQRVGLARALAVDPLVLLLDEPFSGLDPLIRTEMQEELLRLQRQLKKTIIFITHDLDEALFLGDRIGVLHEGKLIEEGTPRNLVLQPQTDWVRQFVQHANMLNVLTVEDMMIRLDDRVQGATQALPFVTDEAGRVIGTKPCDGMLVSQEQVGDKCVVVLNTLVLREFLMAIHGKNWPAAVVADDGHLIGYVTKERVAESLTRPKGVD